MFAFTRPNVKKVKGERRIKRWRLKEDNAKVFTEKVITEVDWEMILNVKDS